jgi:hypothetical protein
MKTCFRQSVDEGQFVELVSESIDDFPLDKPIAASIRDLGMYGGTRAFRVEKESSGYWVMVCRGIAEIVNGGKCLSIGNNDNIISIIRMQSKCVISSETKLTAYIEGKAETVTHGLMLAYGMVESDSSEKYMFDDDTQVQNRPVRSGFFSMKRRRNLSLDFALSDQMMQVFAKAWWDKHGSQEVVASQLIDIVIKLNLVPRICKYRGRTSMLAALSRYLLNPMMSKGVIDEWMVSRKFSVRKYTYTIEHVSNGITSTSVVRDAINEHILEHGPVPFSTDSIIKKCNGLDRHTVHSLMRNMVEAQPINGFVLCSNRGTDIYWFEDVNNWLLGKCKPSSKEFLLYSSTSWERASAIKCNYMIDLSMGMIKNHYSADSIKRRLTESGYNKNEARKMVYVCMFGCKIIVQALKDGNVTLSTAFLVSRKPEQGAHVQNAINQTMRYNDMCINRRRSKINGGTPYIADQDQYNDVTDEEIMPGKDL